MDSVELKLLHNEFKILQKKIVEYNTIIIYRHISPDFDALGGQYGLSTWIKVNFPNKKVYTCGDINNNLIPLIYPQPDNITDDILNNEHLAITLDVADKKRISDNHIEKAKEVIKIDHHPVPENNEDKFGDYVFAHPNFASVCEIIALFCLSRSKSFITNSETSKYLYSGIIGDTNRFLYPATKGFTLKIAGDLLDKGFDKDDLYNKIYQMDERRLKILKHCLNNYKLTKKGTAYIIFDKKELKELNMEEYEGNNYLHVLRDIDNIKIVLSITYNKNEKNYKISFRSKDIVLNQLASKYNGGGHKYASGGKLESLDDLDKLLNDCDKLIN